MDTPRNIRHEYMLEIMDRLYEQWQKHPEMRFMQMLINACPHDDLYYVEDEKLINNLKEL